MFLFACLLACSYVFILIVNFFAVNELQGYLVITASDSDKKALLFYLRCATSNTLYYYCYCTRLMASFPGQPG